MSWQQLLDILHEDRQRRQQEQAAPPESCPNDGTPLISGPRGELFCRSDGWRWPRDHVAG